MKLRIDNGKSVVEPVVVGDVLYESFAKGQCSVLKLNMVGGSVREGDIVSLDKMFLGVVFSRRKSSDGIVSVTAYDQLRYLKNRDTYVYSKKRASDVVRMIALDYKLRLGDVQKTNYVIPNRIEDNVSLFDMIENALDIELLHSGKSFTLLDEFGRLSLCSKSSMNSKVELNKNTVGSVSFSSSVDRRSNRVKVSRYDKKSGKRDIYIAKSESSEKKLGVLQHYVKTADNEEKLSDTAKSLLKLRNKSEKRLSVRNAIGDKGVRGGSTVKVKLDEYTGESTVLRCVHKMSANSHLMDLELSV
jgi:hypothetical protein